MSDRRWTPSSRRVGAALAAVVGGSAGAPALHAQASPRASVANANAWLVYVGEHPLARASRTAVHLELQLRRADLGADWQQLLVRGGLTRELRPGVRVGAGYAHVRTHPYGDAPVGEEFPERRSWQQLSLAHATGPASWTHRYRLEQRWVGVTEADGAPTGEVTDWRYANRVRYLARVVLPLGEAPGPAPAYVAGSGELFVSFGRQVQLNVFDQSRTGVALGWHLRPTLRVELGYLHQYLLKANGRDAERNHTIQLALLSSAPLPR